MADKNNPTVGKPSTAAEGTVTQEEFEGALERGLIQVTVERPDPSEAFTKENLEKFIFGEITWAQLMGMTMEEAYNVAEIGSVQPGRANFALTLVPGSPFSRDETWSIRHPRVLEVST